MKKIFSFALVAVTAFGFVGWGALSTHAATTYTAAQVAPHNTAGDCWLIISGQVYDVTNFIPIHPGGSAIVPFCGTDATSIFNSIHGSSGTAASLLPTYLIGSLGVALTTPTNLAGTPTQTTVALTWTGSTGGVAPITYAVIRNGTSVGTTSTTTFTDTGLTASTTYAYIVRAVDGNTPTADTASSSQVMVTTLAAAGGGGGGGGGGGNGTSTPLTAPTNLVGTPTLTTIALTWTASTGGVAPITYTVLRNGMPVGTTTGTSFNNTGLASSTGYTFVVEAMDSAPTPATISSSLIGVMTLRAPVAGGSTGGEQENEFENEGMHATTSTVQTGGSHHEQDDNIGQTGGSGFPRTSGGHSSRHGGDD